MTRLSDIAGRRAAILVAMSVGVVLLAVGCGGGASPPSEQAATSTGPSPVRIAGKTEPQVEVPDIPPPRKLVVRNLVVGPAPKAQVGDRVKVEYTGLNWAGETYSNSWKYSSPPTFELGDGSGRHLEYGLDLGVRGMRAGGRRKVIMPPRLIYWPGVPHAPLDRLNTLIFIVDLLKLYEPT